MITSFDTRTGLIIVRAHLWGPAGERTLRLALDTGATYTIVRTAILVALGYDPALSTKRIMMTMGSSVEYVPLVTVQRLASLDRVQSHFTVASHTLPPSASLDGLLGLNFVQNLDLLVSFRRGIITLD